ncbi:hypothetical protein MIR68_008660 [Amoeboaphelidium protococcarum]|nr:hypothetical protein MIR68_008660 [Amoeboaphelidium protococcarum]
MTVHQHKRRKTAGDEPSSAMFQHPVTYASQNLSSLQPQFSQQQNALNKCVLFPSPSSQIFLFGGNKATMSPSSITSSSSVQSYHHDVHSFISGFMQLTDQQKDALLNTLVSSHCSIRQLSLLANITLPRLRVDIIGQLPHELALHVLSFLPIESACQLSQCSRLHQSITEDDHFWKQMCIKYEYMANKSQDVQCSQIASQNSSLSDLTCMVPLTPVSARSKASIDTYLMDIDTAGVQRSFKNQFISEYTLNQNWNKGQCSHISQEGTKSAIVTCLQIQGQYLAVATDNSAFGLVEVYDLSSGKRIRRFTGHDGGVWAMEFRNNVLVSGGCDRDLRVWDIRSSTCRLRLSGHTSTIRCLKMLDENRCVTGSRDNTLRVWDILNGECLHVLRGHTGSIRCLSVHDNLVLSGSYDNNLRLWDLQSGQCVREFTGHDQQIYSVCFDGRFACSGSLDASVRVWDAKTGSCLVVLEGHDSLVGHMQLKDDVLVTGGSDGYIFVWDMRMLECKYRLEAHANSVTSLQFQGDRLVTGGDDGVKIWDLKTGKLIRTLLEDTTGIWRLAIDKTRLVTAIQKGSTTTIEMMDFSR